MNIDHEIIHDNQNEEAADIIIRVTGISLNMKDLIREFPSGLPYGDPIVTGFKLNVNYSGAPSMTCTNGEMNLYVDPDAEWETQEVTLPGYTYADRLSLENRINQVIRQANGE